jgi:hypothetical protein
MSSASISDQLTQLEARRREWVETTRDNEFDQGIRRLLSHLNPDEAHFVYELLQNAEDARASTVDFELRGNELRVVHDGRLFSLEDVKAITSIGESDKRKDVDAIGKFGVGFKSVFSFTDAPCIYSGEYNFEIRDMVIPTKVEPIDMSPLDTVFVFPLRNGQENMAKAYDEISRGLRGLDHTAILFLRNIKSIRWEIPGSSSIGLRPPAMWTPILNTTIIGSRIR